MSRKKGKIAALILAASLAQAFVYPSLAFGIDAKEIPHYSTAELETTAPEAQNSEQPEESDTAANMDNTAVPDTTNGSPEEQTNAPEANQTPEADKDAEQTPADPEDASTGNNQFSNEEAGPQIDTPTGASEDITPRNLNGLKCNGKNECYYYQNGVIYTGELKIDGYWYYFDPAKNGLRATSKFVKLIYPATDTTKETEKTAYYDAQGRMVKDTEKKIGDYWYLFDKHGARQYGFQWVKSNNGKTVYYDKNGRMLYGEQKIDGYWYLFGKHGERKYRFQKVNSNGGKTVFYQEKTGRMLYNEQKIGGHWYLFAKNGAMRKGFQNVSSNGGKKVYYNSHGHMVYGEQKIKGAWYLFANNGAMKTGFQNVRSNGGKTVFYDRKTGKMVHGQAIIDGRPYYFDRANGRKWNRNQIIKKLSDKGRSLHKIWGLRDTVNFAIKNAGGFVCPVGPCMSFVWYLFHTCDLDVFLANGGAANGRPTGDPDTNYTWYAKRGRVSGNPKVGDLVFYDWNSPYSDWCKTGNGMDHAGFVLEVKNGRATILDLDNNTVRIFPNTWAGAKKIMYASPYYS